jgi:hypothetical protein
MRYLGIDDKEINGILLGMRYEWLVKKVTGVCT